MVPKEYHLRGRFLGSFLQRLRCLGSRVGPNIYICISSPDASRKEGHHRGQIWGPSVGMGYIISRCPLSGPKWPRPISSACDVHFAQLILKAQPTASCKRVSIGTRTRGGVVAMDCTGVQLKSKGLGDSGGNTERGWCFLQLPGFSESSSGSSMTQLWHWC